MSDQPASRDTETIVDGQVALEAWLKVSHALTRDLPLTDVLNVIAEVARDLSGNLFAMIALSDASRTRLVVRGAAGLPDEYLAVANEQAPLLVNPPAGHAETPSVEAFRTGKPVTVDNLFADNKYADYTEAARHQGYTAIHSVPLAGPGELGVLTVYASTPDLFSASRVDLLAALAKGAAAAIETANLRQRELSIRTELQEVDRMHQRLTRIALANRGMDPIVRALAEMTGYDMRLEDAVSGHVLATWPPDHPGPSLTPDERAPLIEQAARTNEPAQIDSEADEPVYLTPIVLGGDVAAYLWAAAPKPLMATAQARVLERGATVIAHELLKQRHTDEVDWRLRADLFRDLLALEPGEQPQMLTRARSYGLDLTQPHAIIVARPDPIEGPHPFSTASQADAALERIVSTVRAVAARTRTPALIAALDGAVNVLWPASGAPERSVAQLARDIRTSTTSRGPSASVAVGDICDNPLNYRIAVQLAGGALRVTQESGARGRLVNVDDLGVYRLLLSVDDPAILRDFSSRVLEPLRKQEARQADLLETLRAYLENDLQSNKTADILHVHPNTLAYRLRRIEALTGSHLRSSRGLLELGFAVAVDRFIAGADLTS